MTIAFVPDEFLVPQRVETQKYILFPLTTAVVEKDYEAVMSSTESLRQIFGPADDWPAETMTLADNYRDLERHHRDFEERQGFTYTVESPDGNRCLGCVYIYPTQRGEYDAQVYYWVRDSLKAEGLAEELGDFLHTWLQTDWPFQRPAFPGREQSWERWQALKKSETDK